MLIYPHYYIQYYEVQSCPYHCVNYLRMVEGPIDDSYCKGTLKPYKLEPFQRCRRWAHRNPIDRHKGKARAEAYHKENAKDGLSDEVRDYHKGRTKENQCNYEYYSYMFVPPLFKLLLRFFKLVLETLVIDPRISTHFHSRRFSQN